MYIHKKDQNKTIPKVSLCQGCTTIVISVQCIGWYEGGSVRHFTHSSFWMGYPWALNVAISVDALWTQNSKQECGRMQSKTQDYTCFVLQHYQILIIDVLLWV